MKPFPNQHTVFCHIVLSGLMIFASPLHAASLDEDVLTIHSSSYPAAREAARQRLYSGGPDAITAIVKALSSSDQEERSRLFQELAGIRSANKALQVRDADSHELARLARQEKDPGMHAALALALLDLKGPVAVEELEKFASDDPDEMLRLNATKYVASISTNESAFFKKQTKDSSTLIRLAAYLELAALGDKSGHELALQTLDTSKQRNERVDAIGILGEVGDPADVALLKQIADSKTENYMVKISATGALKTIELLGIPAKGRLDFLIKSLDDSNGRVRNWAYTKLWSNTDPATSSRLKKYLSEPGHSSYKEAAHALDLR